MLGLASLASRLVLSPCEAARTSQVLASQALAPGLGGLGGLRWRHNVIRDLKKDYNIKRERPLGPHKHKPPNLVGNRNSLNYHHIIHYPEDGKYTHLPLKVTKLGGRHPITGQKVIEGVGGGSKQKHRWVDLHRLPLDWDREQLLEERVVEVRYDPMRDAQIMLTGYGKVLRWQLATDKVKEGDVLRTHTSIPTNPVRPVEGDAHPLGALPLGTTVCCVEAWPGEGAILAIKAEQNGRVMRKVEHQGSTRVVVKLWNDLEYAIPQEATCTVGTVSIHPLKALDIGSPNRLRWIGKRPRSGLWHRKDGRSGRKIKKPPPAIYTMPKAEWDAGAGTPSNVGFRGRTVLLDALSEGKLGRLKPHKRAVPDAPKDSLAYKREIRPGFDGKNPGEAAYTYGKVARGQGNYLGEGVHGTYHDAPVGPWKSGTVQYRP